MECKWCVLELSDDVVVGIGHVILSFRVARSWMIHKFILAFSRTAWICFAFIACVMMRTLPSMGYEFQSKWIAMMGNDEVSMFFWVWAVLFLFFAWYGGMLLWRCCSHFSVLHYFVNILWMVGRWLVTQLLLSGSSALQDTTRKFSSASTPSCLIIAPGRWVGATLHNTWWWFEWAVLSMEHVVLLCTVTR